MGRRRPGRSPSSSRQRSLAPVVFACLVALLLALGWWATERFRARQFVEKTRVVLRPAEPATDTPPQAPESMLRRPNAIGQGPGADDGRPATRETTRETSPSPREPTLPLPPEVDPPVREPEPPTSAFDYEAIAASKNPVAGLRLLLRQPAPTDAATQATFVQVRDELVDRAWWNRYDTLARQRKREKARLLAQLEMLAAATETKRRAQLRESAGATEARLRDLEEALQAMGYVLDDLPDSSIFADDEVRGGDWNGAAYQDWAQALVDALASPEGLPPWEQGKDD